MSNSFHWASIDMDELRDVARDLSNSAAAAFLRLLPETWRGPLSKRQLTRFSGLDDRTFRHIWPELEPLLQAFDDGTFVFAIGAQAHAFAAKKSPQSWRRRLGKTNGLGPLSKQ